MDTVVIVPLNALDRAKGRLAAELDAAARRDLAGWMLASVVAACLGVDEVTEVLVVAGDEAGARLARDAGARAVVQTEPGLNPAIALADLELAGATSTLVVAADLPRATSEDVARVIAAAPSGPAVVVAPTWDGGTGALYRRPPGAVPPAYGPGSAGAHLALAEAAGVAAIRVDVPGLSMDIDTPEQLADWRAGFSAGLPGA